MISLKLRTGGCGDKVPERVANKAQTSRFGVANKVQMLVFGTNFVIWGC